MLSRAASAGALATVVRILHAQLRVPSEHRRDGIGHDDVVALNYTKVPLRRPRFGVRGIWERDAGVCQYTGRKLDRHEGNIDHVVPRSRGGKTSWDNCVLAHREINSRKADRLPHEAGLRLHKRPSAPRPLPTSAFIRNHHGVSDWEHFLG